MNILFFLIPLFKDYEIIKNHDYRNEIFWWKKLKVLKKYKNFIFLIWLIMLQRITGIFFSNKCDGHWNSEGHQWAGEIISKYLLEFDVLK